MITDDELNLMRWFVATRLSSDLKKAVCGRYMDDEDLVQDGAVHFLKCPPLEGVNRKTALCKACKWAVLRRLSERKRRSRNSGVWERDITPKMELNLRGKGNDVDAVDAREFVQTNLPRMSEKRRDTLCRLFGIGGKEQSPEEIAAERGTTKEAVSWIKCASFEELKTRYL